MTTKEIEKRFAQWMECCNRSNDFLEKPVDERTAADYSLIQYLENQIDKAQRAYYQAIDEYNAQITRKAIPCQQ